MRSNAVGGGGNSLAWVVAIMMPLQGAVGAAAGAAGGVAGSCVGNSWRRCGPPRGQHRAELQAASWTATASAAVAAVSDVGIVSMQGIRLRVNIEKNHVGVTTLEVLCLDFLIVRQHVGYCTYISVGWRLGEMTVGSRDTHMS
jgi:hypothetical protein